MVAVASAQVNDAIAVAASPFKVARQRVAPLGKAEQQSAGMMLHKLCALRCCGCWRHSSGGECAVELSFGFVWRPASPIDLHARELCALLFGATAVLIPRDIERLRETMATRAEEEQRRAAASSPRSLDSDEALGFMWGDLGMLYFWIREQDARRRAFDKTWFAVQCG